jgi:hypothetical protein
VLTQTQPLCAQLIRNYCAEMAAIAARDYKPKCVQSRKSGKLMLQGYELKEIPEVSKSYNSVTLGGVYLFFCAQCRTVATERNTEKGRAGGFECCFGDRGACLRRGLVLVGQRFALGSHKKKC